MAVENSLMLLGSTLVGGFLAIFGGLASVYYAERIKNKRLANSLAWAFYGEISSLCKIVRVRSYIKAFRDLADDARNGVDSGRRSVKADKEYFLIFRGNANQIGMLSAGLPEKIVSFYTHGTAILEDFHAFSSGFHDDKSLEVLVGCYDDIANMLYCLLEQGEDILQIIERNYS